MSQVRGELARQHAWLDDALRELLRLTVQSDHPALQKAWTHFESELLKHLELEERHLFPIVEGEHPEAVRGLRIEHDRIREVVSELGLACDLHTVRRESMAKLARWLEAHAAAEDRGLYRWADELAPLETRRQLLSSLLGPRPIRAAH